MTATDGFYRLVTVLGVQHTVADVHRHFVFQTGREVLQGFIQKQSAVFKV